MGDQTSGTRSGFYGGISAYLIKFSSFKKPKKLYEKFHGKRFSFEKVKLGFYGEIDRLYIMHFVTVQNEGK